MSGHGGGWANPAPAGLVALAVAGFTFFALLTGKVDHSCIPLLGIWLFGGGIVQLVVGLIELNEGALVGGNVFTFFAAFFMFVGAFEFIFKYFAALNGWQVDARIDGWAWMVLWIAVWLWTPAYFKVNLAMSLLLITLDIAVPIVALMDLHMIEHSYAPIAGTMLLITGICGLWQATAIILNGAFGRTVIPTGPPLIK